MTTERSTYTYEHGERETVTLKRGPATPTGHALLKIEYSDGLIVDCYVNTAWLRDRVDDLDPRPLTPDAITDEMVDRAVVAYNESAAGTRHDHMRDVLSAALTPPARPEGAEDIEALIRDLLGSHPGDWYGDLADHLAAHLTDPTRKEA